MNHMTMILANPKTGQPEAFRVDLEKLAPATIPRGMAGPFLYTFEMDSGDGIKQFEASVMMNDEKLTAMFTEYPVVAKITERWTTAGHTKAFGEFRDTGKDQVLSLKASLFGKSHIWIDIDRGHITGGSYDAKTKKSYALPFYNFYNHGDVCLGGLEGTLAGKKPLHILNLFLASFTTPHATMADRQLKFRPNLEKGIVVTDKVPNCDLFDFPIDTAILDKPIARLTP